MTELTGVKAGIDIRKGHRKIVIHLWSDKNTDVSGINANYVNIVFVPDEPYCIWIWKDYE